MEKFLERLLASDLLTEGAKDELRESFKAVLEEAQEQARDDARRELAEQYKADRDRLVEALDKMTREALTSHLVEFKEDVDLLHKAKAKAAKQIAEADDIAKRKVSRALKKLEETNRSVIKNEIGELVEDFKLQRAQHVKLMKEGRATLAAEKNQVVKRMAKVLEHLAGKELKNIMVEYKQDIRRARENNFGRKMFEAFAAEFETSHFSRDKVLDSLKTKVTEANKRAKALKQLSASKIAKLEESVSKVSARNERLEENIKRSRKMGALLKPLVGTARSQMKNLLEGVSVEKMDTTFKKYLPHVTDQKSSRKRISEAKGSQRRELGTLRTGSRAVLESEAPASEAIDNDIEQLRRRLPNANRMK